MDLATVAAALAAVLAVVGFAAAMTRWSARATARLAREVDDANAALARVGDRTGLAFAPAADQAHPLVGRVPAHGSLHGERAGVRLSVTPHLADPEGPFAYRLLARPARPPGGAALPPATIRRAARDADDREAVARALPALAGAALPPAIEVPLAALVRAAAAIELGADAIAVDLPPARGPGPGAPVDEDALPALLDALARLARATAG